MNKKNITFQQKENYFSWHYHLPCALRDCYPRMQTFQ